MKPLIAAIVVLPWTFSLAHAHSAAHHARPVAASVDAQQTSWGIAGDPARVVRTITLEMDDQMRFTPDRIDVDEGETVRLVARNGGRLLHEIVLGTPEELAKHAALMAKFPDMEHDEPYMAHVAAGAAGEVVWHFNRPGEIAFACLIPGHFEAGMKGVINVRPTKGVIR